MATHTLPTLRRHAPLHQDTRSPLRRMALGAQAGLLGALLVVLAGGVDAVARNMGVFAQFKWVAAGLMGESALVGGVGVVVGLVAHFVLGGALGLCFSLLIPRAWSRFPVIIAGTLFGVTLSVLHVWWVLPALNPVMYDRIHPATFLVQHVLFGFAVGMVAPAAGTLHDAVDSKRRAGERTP